jgi:hypothetical protein
MDWIGLIIQLVLGAVGGNAGAAMVKNASLGSTGNSVVGAVGGIILGQILNQFTGGAPVPVDPAAAAAASTSIGSIIQNVIGGGVGGAVLTIIAGYIKNSMSKA